MVLVASEKAGTACLDVFKIVQGWHLDSWTGAVVLLLVHGSIQTICTTLEMAIGAIWLLQPVLERMWVCRRVTQAVCQQVAQEVE